MIKYLRNDNKIHTKLFALKELGVSKKAEEIYKIITKELLTSPIMSKNCLGYASDNARTLSGENNALYGLLKKKYKHIVRVGDISHKLNNSLLTSLRAAPLLGQNIVQQIQNEFVSSV